VQNVQQRGKGGGERKKMGRLNDCRGNGLQTTSIRKGRRGGGGGGEEEEKFFPRITKNFSEKGGRSLNQEGGGEGGSLAASTPTAHPP